MVSLIWWEVCGKFISVVSVDKWIFGTDISISRDRGKFAWRSGEWDGV